ncbi:MULTISPECIES: succinate dehydrogenase assembly factor 2 [unclassified Anaerobiospirillum]|uniref:FAD assembly factor SdhE n=1 Tax=unclassified Anaerobiospirillum TaxID=2647410 RepID=UPI001FF1A751|nr:MULTISPECIES: succinate dehydrogenase assembly factor 2 [unclassified Anaerobiospirillum]MCK0526280.1 succinate dehydrogenase assembly factor 2 [Anaerobiospirillum sp. NML120449]MCK0535296.1 succinate dehydrogenase assembly factor 2 [Anaerobiospirillum sp. NML120511]MCK0540509.1 succinate dehydrogenase assembly factor 2 [Anaerobiospirillum sp. NML02-A-032]
MSEINWGKIKWQSRRGMRELDLMLLPFVEHDLPGMAPEVVDDYMDLLDATDLQLFRWLHQTESPDSERRQKMVETIIACHATRAGREGV